MWLAAARLEQFKSLVGLNFWRLVNVITSCITDCCGWTAVGVHTSVAMPTLSEVSA